MQPCQPGRMLQPLTKLVERCLQRGRDQERIGPGLLVEFLEAASCI